MAYIYYGRGGGGVRGDDIPLGNENFIVKTSTLLPFRGASSASFQICRQMKDDSPTLSTNELGAFPLLSSMASNGPGAWFERERERNLSLEGSNKRI